VFITPSAFKPDKAWTLELAAAFRRHFKETGLLAEIIIHDRDGKFSQPFDDAVRDAGVKVRKTAF
jgi:hypothetical protein